MDLAVSEIIAITKDQANRNTLLPLKYELRLFRCQGGVFKNRIGLYLYMNV
jgi:hypothetical protein